MSQACRRAPFVRVVALVTLVVLPGTVGWAQLPASIVNDSTIAGYLREVIADNPGLKGKWRLVAAAGRRIPAAGALPDPMVTSGVMSLPHPSFSFSAEGMTQVPIQIEQRVPGFGKRSAETARATADSTVLHARARAAEAAVVADALARVARLAERRTALVFWGQRLALAEAAADLAEARYAAGTAPQTDALRARMRRAQLDEEGHALDGEVQAALAAANALRSLAGELTTPTLVGTVEDTTPLPHRAALTAQLTDRHPALAVGRFEITQAERRAQISDLAGRPDFMVSVQEGIRFGGREPFLTAMIGISLPLWQGRKQGPLAEAAALEVEAARDRFTDLQSQIDGEAAGLLATLEALTQQIFRLRTEVLPLADAASASALQQYRIGTVDLSTVLDAQDDAYRARLQLAGLLRNDIEGRARLALMLGEEWYR